MNNIPYLRLSKYNLAGQLITSFGNNGTVGIFGSKIYLTVNESDGSVYCYLKGYYDKIIKLNSNGVQDQVFGTKEYANIQSSKILLTTNGSALIVLRENDSSNVKITKINPDSSVDLSFGNQGVASVSGISANFFVNNLNEIFGLNQGKLTKYNSNAILDTSFGSSGILQLNVLFPNKYIPTSMAFDSSNKMIMFANNQLGMVGRLNVDGTIDGTFNSGSGYFVGGSEVNSSYIREDVVGRLLDDNTFYLFRSKRYPLTGEVVVSNKFLRKNSLSVNTSKLNNLHILQNPVNDILRIKLKSNETLKSLQIYSLEGILIKSSSELKVNVATLPKGNYVLKIFTVDDVYTEKLIKK